MKKKRIIQLTIIFIEVFIIIILFINVHYIKPKYIQVPAPVFEEKEIIPSIEIKDVNERKATVIITDLNKERLTFGRHFRFEKKINNEWEPLMEENVNDNIICGEWANTLEGYSAGEDNKLEMTYGWGTRCGKISSGTYRICTAYYYNYKDKHICAEFEIK